MGETTFNTLTGLIALFLVPTFLVMVARLFRLVSELRKELDATKERLAVLDITDKKGRK